MNANAPKAVLFDMDGVLVDSFPMWLHTMNEVAAMLGCPPIPEDALRAAFGQGVEDDLRTFYAGCTRAQLEDAYAQTLPRHAHRIAVNPTAPAALEALAARGIPRAVVTNTQAGAVPGLLTQVGLASHFDAVLGITPAVAAKPAPDLLLAACAHLGVDAAEALMVGDSIYDRDAATAAGTPYLHYEVRRGDDLLAALAPALCL